MGCKGHEKQHTAARKHVVEQLSKNAQQQRRTAAQNRMLTVKLLATVASST